MNIHVQSSTTHNNQQVETAQISHQRMMDKQIVIVYAAEHYLALERMKY